MDTTLDIPSKKIHTESSVQRRKQSNTCITTRTGSTSVVMLHTPSTTEKELEHYRRVKEMTLERWGYDKIDNWLEFTAWENGVPKYFRGGDLLQDSSDDCYYVIDGLQDDKHDSHDHPATISLFAPHFKIPKRIRERFERYYQHWIDYNKSLGLTNF